MGKNVVFWLLGCGVAAVAADQGGGPQNQELQALSALVGAWEGDFVIGTDTGNRMTSEQRSEWILDGWYLATHSTARNQKGDSFKLMIITGYDREKGRYTRSFFFSGGGIHHETGSYDPITKTFTFRAGDSATGESRTSTARLEDGDTIRWTMETRKPGEAPVEIAGVNRRKK